MIKNFAKMILQNQKLTGKQVLKKPPLYWYIKPVCHQQEN